MAGMLRLFLNFLGIFWIGMGTLLVFIPDLMRTNVFAKLKDAPLKKISAIPILIGVLLFLSAAYCRFRLFIIALGMLSLLKGILFLVATGSMTKITNKWIKMGNNAYRAHGILIIIIGSIILRGI